MKRHPVELLSLISGIVFLVFALAYIVGAAMNITLQTQLTLPLLLVGLGAAGIAAAVVAQRRLDDAPTPPEPEPTDA